MSENESASKKGKMVYDSGRNMLSELPSSIIDIILASISTRDAVGMSILSRQFRYKWINLPHLVFDLSDFSSDDFSSKFVTNVLKLHEGPIHKFELSAFLEQNWPIVDDWLLFLPRNDIRELILKLGFDGEAWHEVHSIVYSCNRLTHLELRGCNLGPPPLTFRGFLFLRCLNLIDVVISLNDIESIVARSPLIETLRLDGCGGSDQSPVLRISAPNLKNLYLINLEGDCMEIYLCAPRLTEIDVILYDYVNAVYDYLQKENGSVCNYTNFLGGCTSLENLRGDFCFTKVLSIGIDSCEDSFVLHRLKVIDLNGVNFYDVKQMSVVARLVMDSPNLQMLTIRFKNLLGSEDEEDSSYMDLLHASNFKWEKLTIIKMLGVTNIPSERKFIKLLLENSPALERMTLFPDGLDSDEVKDLREELLKCDAASPNFTLCTDRIGA